MTTFILDTLDDATKLKAWAAAPYQIPRAKSAALVGES